MAKLLLVEDDESLAQTVGDWLRLARHTVDVVSNGNEALEWLVSGDYAVGILDWNLPGLSGIEILKRFRDGGGTTPILMLTARSSIEDKISGLDDGADDYIAKPFELRELEARIRALLRRDLVTKKVGTIEFNDLTLDTVTADVFCNGTKLRLRRTEYALLEVLMHQPGKIFTSEQLLRKVWSTDSDTSTDTVRTHVTRLRKKIEAVSSSTTISNTYGLGYKLIYTPKECRSDSE